MKRARQQLILSLACLIFTACGSGAFSGKTDSTSHTGGESDQTPLGSTDPNIKIEEIETENAKNLDDILDGVTLPGVDIILKKQLDGICSPKIATRALKISGGLDAKTQITVDTSTIIILVGNSFEFEVTAVNKDVEAVCVLSVGNQVKFNMTTDKSISDVLLLTVGNANENMVQAKQPSIIGKYTNWAVGNGNATKLIGDGQYSCPTPINIGFNNKLECTDK